MSSAQKQEVRFTQEQIQYLEKLYPEITTQAPYQDVLFRMGQRSVLARIKELSKVEVRLVPR